MKTQDKIETLQLFFFGPGFGESIAVHLPDGQWGLVDCYIRRNEEGVGVLEFLRQKGVGELAFFCLTHPHADHYMGAEQVLNQFAGRIHRLWQWDGLTTKALETRAIVAAKVRAAKRRNSRADECADGLLAVIEAIANGRKKIREYRRVTSPTSLLKTCDYEISAIRPNHNLVADIEDKILAKNVNAGYFVLNEDEEGSLLNNLSIVLLLEFGEARVLLLGDAEGAAEALHQSITQITAIKIAHHGSCNGLGADGFCCPPTEAASIPCLVITPYSKNRLPRIEMIERYRIATKNLIVTAATQIGVRPSIIPPTLQNARLVNGPCVWHGIEVRPTGEVRPCN
jgi:hypothetical protein